MYHPYYARSSTEFVVCNLPAPAYFKFQSQSTEHTHKTCFSNRKAFTYHCIEVILKPIDKNVNIDPNKIVALDGIISFPGDPTQHE